MKQIVLTITAEAPLAIGQQKPGGSVSEALEYIPGSVIRGAIAAKILAQAGSDPGLDADGNEDDFHQLFLGNHAAIFQNAYPAIAQIDQDERVDQNQGDYVLVSSKACLLPATALSSKTDGGFKIHKTDGTIKKVGVFDSLIDSFCAREHGHFYEPNDLQGDRVEPFKGFYSQQDKRYRSHTISKRLLTRVGINRRRATAEEQILYSIEVLNELQGKKKPQPSVYRGAIVLENDELAAQLNQFINHYQRKFRLGGSTSRGLGKVFLQSELQDVPISTEQITSRIQNFNANLGDRWTLWNIFQEKALPKDKHFFTLDLQSDAILTESWRRTMVISETMLRQYAQVEDPTLKLEIAYSSYDYRSGWNAAWGLKKDVELITNMAGVYLFSTESLDRWYEPLATLEQRGVGDRTSEGFGQLKVCDEFHLVFREEPV